MMDIPAFLLTHTVSVEPYAGAGAYGPAYGAVVDVPCFIDYKRRLVRDSSTGEQVTSAATVYAQLDAGIPLQSRVTLPTGAKTVAVQVNRHDGGSLPVPSSLEVVLA